MLASITDSSPCRNKPAQLVVSDFSFSLRSSAKTFAPSAVNKTPKIFIAEDVLRISIYLPSHQDSLAGSFAISR